MIARRTIGIHVMKASRSFWLIFLMIALLFHAINSSALILSSTGNQPVTDPGWPGGVLALANLPSRVGWWEGPPFGGGEWQFLYRGDAKALSEALTNFAAIRAPSLELVIHDGPQTNIFIKDSGDGRVDWAFTVWVPAKWIELYNNPTNNWNSADPNFHKPVAPPKLDVYIGGGEVDWSQVKVPPGIHVEDQRSAALRGLGHGSNPPELSLTIRCTNAVLKAGDEIPVEFTIKNVGAENYEYPDRTYDRSGRMNEYELVAKTESGEEVRDPRAGAQRGWMMGGLFGYRVLQPGQSFSKTIPLNRWALVKEPGRYTVVGNYCSDLYSTNSIVVKSEPITITVLTRTPAEMDAYIDDLSNKLAAIPSVRLITSTHMPEKIRVTNSVPDPATDALVMKLMYTCSPKIVPTLLKTMCEPASSGFWESEALLYYVPRSEEIKKALLKTATGQGLPKGLEYVLDKYGVTADQMKALIKRSLAPDSPQTWEPGAVAAQHFSDNSFSSRLIAIATDPNSSARDQAIYALAANRTEGTVAALKLLLESNDPKIHATVTNAIRTAYFYRGIWTGTPLKADDFPSLYHKPY